MFMSKKKLDPGFLRQQIVGVDSTFETPFGERLMVYCDYTASGRCLRFVESYLQSLQRVYANTHTEDDITGRSMSQLRYGCDGRDRQAAADCWRHAGAGDTPQSRRPSRRGGDAPHATRRVHRAL